MHRVAICMSGGKDSSVAAYILKHSGYEVFGITMYTKELSHACDSNIVEAARRVAEYIGIPHHAIELTEEFKNRVIDYFANEYINGRTPNPCAICNRELKFGLLWDKVREMGADYIATGHYARIVEHNSEFYIREAKDLNKSQAYFLALLQPSVLPHVIFPLGELTHAEVIDIARNAKLPVAQRTSQDLCFVNGNYVEFLQQHYNVELTPGDVIDYSGRKLGTHRGYLNYTVGQRKGLGIPAGSPLYVLKIDATNNRIVVGTRKHAYKKRIDVKLIVWRLKSKSVRVNVRIRYRHTAAPANVVVDGSIAHVEFDTPQFAPTPGQLAAFYDGDIIVGGGIIET